MSAIEDHFRTRIVEGYGALKELFIRGVKEEDREAFQDMGRLIGEHAVLGTPRGQRIKGAEAIGLFFEEMWKNGKFDVEFNLKGLWVIPTERPIRTKKKDDVIAEVGYYITEFRFQGNPSTVAGGWSGTACHIGGCPIKP